MDKITLPSGLKYQVIKVARKEALSPKKGQIVSVDYTGWLDDAGNPGEKFDSSVDRGQKFSFPVGVGMVIQGWDEAVSDMKVGEKRRLFIPPHLAYGSQGVRGVIPPNAGLIFDVELFDIK